jgi:DNA-binding beta-propeller fold protein YncE
MQRGTGAVSVTGQADRHSSAQVWVRRNSGGGGAGASASSVAVSADGGTVFVTGSAGTTTPGDDVYVTVAYNAATGAQLWVRRYNGPVNSNGGATSVAVSPDGGTVYVTGQSQGTTSLNYATIAYNAATGARLWVARSSGPVTSFAAAFGAQGRPGWSQPPGTPGTRPRRIKPE